MDGGDVPGSGMESQRENHSVEKSLNVWQSQRRQVLQGGGMVALTSLMSATATAQNHTIQAVHNSNSLQQGEFPDGFLWGAATAGHQVEGGNINSDSWLLENMKPTLFDEPSGDACDHYHRFGEDIALLPELGLNTFRFSLEWSRIEPEPGQFSLAEIDHYRRVLQTCHRMGVTPMVTYNHFTTPRWFAGMGGWESPNASQLFARYCAMVTSQLGELMGMVTTLNEPNLIQLLFGIPGLQQTKLGTIEDQEIIRKAGERMGTGLFSSWVFGDYEHIHRGLLLAHRTGYEAIKTERPELQVGVSIAMEDDQVVEPGGEGMLDKKQSLAYVPWFDVARRHADFFGVQCYSRCRIGPSGRLPPEPGVPLTDMGYEFYPEALEGALRYTHQHLKIPLYVTENGVATTDDTRRIEYIRRAVAGVSHCLASDIDVRGYIHWSLLDNFEWLDGYRPHFGLVSVDHKTFHRHIKPSAVYLGEIARHNHLMEG